MRVFVLANLLSLALFSIYGFSAHSGPTQKEGSETWVAFSKTAESITGNITITPSTIEMSNGKTLHIEAVKGDMPNLYRFNGADKLKLLNNNTLCGDGVDSGFLILDDAQPGSFEIEVFSGNTPPEAGKSAEDHPGFCASYYYSKS
ncbi:hypothetical protein [Pseudovibrio sp. Tun.PSC04-5.I4]|uniref:hypothetical protein n=1 Tax=Pseudovibrio sp. Tun.PSC04-5.I4 TaxID=1798213 RepID=UPI00088D2660|nr:hypothetical protein [Pseudovibrio sp. Tun.PSC04-5.I4]SDR24153.1 hypothetical protein SAMN04515695_3701 [Pseudovibrio sp. Tun.PSC04-5.I4]